MEKKVKEVKKSESVSSTEKKIVKKLTSKQMALMALSFVSEIKALDIVVFDVRKLTTVADFFCICHGTSDRHVKSIAEGVMEAFKKEGQLQLSSEGFEASRWIVVDYADIVVHVFQKEARDYYNLEGIWGDAPRVKHTKSPV